MQIGDAKLKTKHDSTVVNDAGHVFEYRKRSVLFEHLPPSFAIESPLSRVRLRRVKLRKVRHIKSANIWPIVGRHSACADALVDDLPVGMRQRFVPSASSMSSSSDTASTAPFAILVLHFHSTGRTTRLNHKGTRWRKARHKVTRRRIRRLKHKGGNLASHRHTQAN